MCPISDTTFAVFSPDAHLAAGEHFLRTYLETSHHDRYVIGLSGGIDSAVVALWAARAVGPERLLLVSMPYGRGMATPTFHPSSEDSLTDAASVASLIPDAPFIRTDITAEVDSLMARLAADTARLTTLAPSAATALITVGNTMARIRAVTLRGLANLHGGLVLGTENKTEHLLGYFTLGGDEESDVELLSPYLKTHVRALARALGVPDHVLQKAPSADLRANHTDEGELGFTYSEADQVLHLLMQFTDPTSPTALVAIQDCVGDADRATVDAVYRRFIQTAFKRQAKPHFVSPTESLR